MAAGRSSEGRSVTGVGTTNVSAALTAPANSFEAGDVGRTITGTGIPAGATIIAVASATAATLSANATVTGSTTAVLGPSTALGAGIGFIGWSPETHAESLVHTRAGGGGAASAHRPLNAITSVHIQRARG